MIRLKLSSYFSVSRTHSWEGSKIYRARSWEARRRISCSFILANRRLHIFFFLFFFRKPRQANASRSRGHGSSQIRYNYSCRKNGWIQSAPLSPPHFLFCTFSSLPTILFRCFSSNHRFFLTLLCSLDPPRLFRVLITSYYVNSGGIFSLGREFF